MNSIFESNGNDLLVARINHLTPESQPIWGKMSVDQMLKHCECAVNVAFGMEDLKVNFFMRLLGRLLKKKVFTSEFRKNSPTAKEFIFTATYDFEPSKNALIVAVQKFKAGPSAIVITQHPFWGKLTEEDWNTLMWKHLDHHLKQFGV